MNRLSKVLITLSAALGLATPTFAAGSALGMDLGGPETVLMALVLMLFVAFLQKFNK